MFCLCGGASGDFKAIPFDTKQQLISYHTEGQGEDKVPFFDCVLNFFSNFHENAACLTVCFCRRTFLSFTLQSI